ncbi:MAG: undecaprenyl-diphosphatase, partial [Thalassobium sp.]
GVLISAISAWVCIYYFLAFISRIGMLPFVVYRLLLGGMLLLFFV